MKGGVDGLMLDSAPPTAGKLRRASWPSGREGIWPAAVGGDYFVNLFHHPDGFVQSHDEFMVMLNILF